ncbi:MAG TPA: 23S rRNA (adenine(2503)-C(2))-methyltransferase RlmN [Planctomycetes bacterium]|nr:23S rRNA (adenine(2503)-C(2))-methyltransferase RlmN [Planctomycetota bacterium]
MTERLNLKDHDREQLRAALAERGVESYRGDQVFRWVWRRGVESVAEMTNLSKALRERLASETRLPRLEPSDQRRAADGTTKLLVGLEDGREVESVLIPDGERRTLCVSTQVGCAMGCVFCASGVAGLKRHLSAAEIVAQVLLGRAQLGEDERLRNVVFMGMGEPLHNYGAVARALVLLTHDKGLGLSTRRVTVSTSGLVPEIDRLAADFDGKVALAISLHAVTDERRSSIMPVNRKYPLGELVACLKRYPLPKRRRITIEYTLIRGVNDDPADADALVALLRGVPAKVNLIPMNPIHDSDLGAPSGDGVERFRDRIQAGGVTATIRRQRGDDVDAACGQLALYGPDGERAERTRRLPVSK